MAIPTAELKKRDGNHYLSFPDGEYPLSPSYLHMLNQYDQLALKVIRRKVQYLAMNLVLVTHIIARPHEHAEPVDLIQPVEDMPTLTHPQIALKHVYERSPITKENQESIAKQYGQTSGHRLKQEYDHYFVKTNRTGEPKDCTKKKLQNQINRIESVIDLLDESPRLRAKDELQILIDLRDKKYP